MMYGGRDMEHFDLQTEQNNIASRLEELKTTVAKPNILICGATGSGKSSLINEMFGKDVAKVNNARPMTRGITRYEKADLSVVLYDSEGYETGKEKLSHFRDNIIGHIDLMRSQHPDDHAKQIHMVWYTVSLAAKRITDLDISLLKDFKERRVPVCVVLTKIDAADEQDLSRMREILQREVPGLKSFTFSAAADPKIREATAAFVQRDELIEYTLDCLPDALKEGLVRACVGSLQEKRKHINKHIIPFYISSACAAVVVPVPLSDSAILAPIQMTMTARIMAIYGIDRVKGAISSILETTVVSQIGKSLSATILGNIAKMFPGVGTGVGIAVNAGVATTVTTALGYAMSELCYQYSKEVLQKGHADIDRYFNAESINKVIGYFMGQAAKKLGAGNEKGQK